MDCIGSVFKNCKSEVANCYRANMGDKYIFFDLRYVF